MITRIAGVRDWMESLRTEGQKTRGAKEGSADAEGYGTSGGQSEDRENSKDGSPASVAAAEDPRERARRDAESLKAALEGFRGDARNQTLGLQVETEGYGPGLKVILKDAQGVKMRVMNREEFVRLREAVGTLGSENGARGGMLDRKV